MTTPESVAAEESGLPIGGKRRATPDNERTRRRTPANDSTPSRSDPNVTRPLIGTLLGKYQVLRKLGEGGMGAVFEGVHSDIGQRAAIKVLHPHLSKEPKFVQRFIDEARLVSMVGHPGLVKVYDYTRTPEGTLCIIMEFLEGESLWSRFDRVRSKRSDPTGQHIVGMPVTDVLQIARQVASALAAVHARGIIHRDLKPDNIMLVKDPDTPSGERAKILDFGIAKLDQAEGGTRNTTTGVSLGTPTYMAPEQIEGQSTPTDRIDVYAFGVILFELLSGQAPFASDTTGGILRQHLIKEPPPLPAHIPDELQALVKQALAKEASERPTMQQIVERIDQLVSAVQVQTGLQSRAAGATVPVRHFQEIAAQTAASRRRLALLAGGALTFLGLGIGAWIWMHSIKPPVPVPIAMPQPPNLTTVAAKSPNPNPPSVPEAPKAPPETTVTKPATPTSPDAGLLPKKTGKGDGKVRGNKVHRWGDLRPRPQTK